MFEELKECKICPNNCKVNRRDGNIGICKADDKVKIALASLHFFEEPCISGEKGSGTVFFSNCNLSCKFCQNYEISALGKGKEITIEELKTISDRKFYSYIKKIIGSTFCPPFRYIINNSNIFISRKS